MAFHFGIRKGKAKSWEEIREEIIKAIEEEKRARSQFISISSVATYPAGEPDKAYSATASEDSYPLVE